MALRAGRSTRRRLRRPCHREVWPSLGERAVMLSAATIRAVEEVAVRLGCVELHGVGSDLGKSVTLAVGLAVPRLSVPQPPTVQQQ